jgi:hypothetical protein
MYSTKRVNSHYVENGAYITIGDPYKDGQYFEFHACLLVLQRNVFGTQHVARKRCSYVVLTPTLHCAPAVKDKLPTRWKGKGFMVKQVPQNAENGNFSKLEYKSCPYAEMEK